MPGEMLQHVIVTIAALAAAATLVRRVLALTGRDTTATPACGSCPTSKGACGADAAPTREATVSHPAVLLRASDAATARVTSTR